MFGPPGVGKGTLASQLAHKLGFAHIATGDLLRDEIKAGSPLGLKVKEIVAQGGFPNDDLIQELLMNRLGRPDARAGIILDGFPRTVNQTNILPQIELQMGCTFNVIVLDAPEKVLIDRILSRLICTGCGAIYNRHTAPPKIEGICDHCGAEVVARADDTPETIHNRLKIYQEKTAPVLSRLKEMEMPISELDASGSAESVLDQATKSF
ncbi:MAG: adenylate kinase [Chlamydiia bacterium]|nr:adenylate kinase [Chlamydiia bacterium]